MKFDEMLMLCVRADITCGKIPMLLGEPDIGKSSWLENLGMLMRTNVFTLACNQLADKADLTGARLVPTPDGDYMQVFYPHATITEAIKYAADHPHETPILFLDELNRTTPDVTSELLSIPTMRAIGSKKLPKNLRVVIAGNDKGNVTSLDSASVSRFVLYRVEPDAETFLSLDQNLNQYVRAVLEAHPDTIFCKSNNDPNADIDENADIEDILTDDDGMSQFTTPRTISGVSDWLNTLSNADLRAMLATPCSSAPDAPSILQEAVQGHVGDTRFAALLLAEIADHATRTNGNSNNHLVISEPPMWKAMKDAAKDSMDALDRMIEGLDQSDRSACLVWALHETNDNEVIVQMLAPRTKELTKPDVSALVRLEQSEDLDPANVHAFLATHCPLAEQLAFVLE